LRSKYQNGSPALTRGWQRPCDDPIPAWRPAPVTRYPHQRHG
jgi:hypothetical protein